MSNSRAALYTSGASAALLLAAGVWTAIASFIFLIGTGLWRQFHFPEALWQYWVYRAYIDMNPTVALWIHRSTTITSIGMMIVMLGLLKEAGGKKLTPSLFGLVKPVKRGATDNLGHANWMSMTDAKQRFPGPDPIFGGVVVGEAYRVDNGKPFMPNKPSTWGKGGKAPLLIDPCKEGPTHSMIFASSGGFKTMSAVSTVLTWKGSSVILDPSGELSPMLTPAIQQQGKRAFTLSPQRPEQVVPWGLNVLDWIDIHDPKAEQHISTVVSWMWMDKPPNEGTTDSGRFFEQRSKSLVRCLLANLMWDESPATPKTLQTLRAAFELPESEMKQLLMIIKDTSNSRMARSIAADMMETFSETFSGIYSGAAEATGWLTNRIYAALVSGDAFRTSDLRRGDVTVFVQIPLSALMTDPVVARVIVGALMSSIYEAEGPMFGRILFLLDEAARLGRMKIIETARDAGRKHGITLQLLYQSVAQLEEQWGVAGKRSWYDGCSWRGYAAIHDISTAEEISAACGKHGVIAYSEGDNTGRSSGQGKGSRSTGSNVSKHEIGRPLVFAAEITQDMRADDMIVIVDGRPLRCGRAIYFRRPEFRNLVNASRFRRQE